MRVEINHYDTPAIKFRALKTHYPTGKYLQRYNDAYERWTCWFELNIDGVSITWFADDTYVVAEEE